MNTSYLFDEASSKPDTFSELRFTPQSSGRSRSRPEEFPPDLRSVGAWCIHMKWRSRLGLYRKARHGSIHHQQPQGFDACVNNFFCVKNRQHWASNFDAAQQNAECNELAAARDETSLALQPIGLNVLQPTDQLVNTFISICPI